jgi:hypothetical protein
VSPTDAHGAWARRRPARCRLLKPSLPQRVVQPVHALLTTPPQSRPCAAQRRSGPPQHDAPQSVRCSPGCVCEGRVQSQRSAQGGGSRVDPTVARADPMSLA